MPASLKFAAVSSPSLVLLIDRSTEQGGYLQWDEGDISAYQSLLLSSEATNAASSQLVQHVLQYFQSCGFKFEYVLLPAV